MYVTKTRKFDLIMDHADEYYGSKYSFRQYGFIKYTYTSEKVVFIDDVYVDEGFRQTGEFSGHVETLRAKWKTEGIMHTAATLQKSNPMFSAMVHLIEGEGLELVTEDEDKRLYMGRL